MDGGAGRRETIGCDRIFVFFSFSFFFSRSCFVVRVCACVCVSGPGVEIDHPQFFKPVFA